MLLDNAEMSLAKTDRLIGARYLALGGRDDLTELVLAEYDLTRRLVLAVTGHDRLLADRHVLSRAVALRDPYVDALSFLQLRALAALREAEPATGGRGPGAAGTAAAAHRERRRGRPAEHRLTLSVCRLSGCGEAIAGRSAGTMLHQAGTAGSMFQSPDRGLRCAEETAQAGPSPRCGCAGGGSPCPCSRS